MGVSDKNRARFEGIGFDLIRRELSVGDITFLGIDKQMRQEAQEWVDEKIADARREKKSNRRWMIVGGVAGVVAAIAAIIAAWPVAKGWIN